MPNGEYIGCKEFASYLTSQEPVYDREILKDIRPESSDLLGFFMTGRWDAYTSNSKRFDRFRHVFPDVTRPWNTVGNTACQGEPCDPPENKIGWGWDREEYGRERQSWATNLLCFDEIMLKTRAKEHLRQIIDDILRPATQTLMANYIARKAAELAGTKIVVRSGLPAFTFTWDPGEYVYMTVSAQPTGKLNPNILQRQVARHAFNGSTTRGKTSFAKLNLFTDSDTFRDLTVLNPTLLTAWRIQQFDSAAEAYYKYGFSGIVGDFVVKCLQFPIRFNKITDTRFQQVLPWKYEAADEGIRSVFNEDYHKAQFQWSYIANEGALEVQPFNPEAVNPNMPFLVRDYGGKWRFATHDLGADAQGRPIENYRQNKGKFYADFDLAIKPRRTEWLDLLFHMRDIPCVTIDVVCNDYPGYPAQTYDDSNPECACLSRIDIVAEANGFGQFVIPANTILVNGAAITHVAVASATEADLVVALAAIWTTAGLDGTWSVADAATNTIRITFTGDDVPQQSITLPFEA